MNIFIAGALQYLMGAFEFLQIVVFSSLIIIQFPANSQFVLMQIKEIINADVIDPELTTDLLFDFQRDYQVVDRTVSN